MDNTKKHPIDFTDEQMKNIEAYARANGMTADQAASSMASAMIQQRFVTRRTAGKVIPFSRRGAK